MRKSPVEYASSFVIPPKCCGKHMVLHEEPTHGQKIAFFFECPVCQHQTGVQEVDESAPIATIMQIMGQLR
jgi:hypothetical protein